jgi:putative holliday junction resolvase
VSSSERESIKEARVAEIRRTAILAIDYGTVRIGLAIADLETGLPRPLMTIDRVNRNEDMRRLREVTREHAVKEIVVGLPLRLDGTRGDMAEEATRFGERVRKQLGLPVEMVDERLTSWEAERLLEEQAGKLFRDDTTPAHVHSSVRKKKQAARATVDAMAAAVILKEYLSRKQNPGGSI